MRWAITSVSVSLVNRRALRGELFLELAEILDDAVMHDRDEVRRVRMRVGLGRLAVRGPAGMADAGGPERRRRFSSSSRLRSLPSAAREMPVLDGGHAPNRSRDIRGASARRRVARRPAFAEDANDAAHRPLLPPALLVDNWRRFRVATHALCPLVSARLRRLLPPLAYLAAQPPALPAGCATAPARRRDILGDDAARADIGALADLDRRHQR